MNEELEVFLKEKEIELGNEFDRDFWEEWFWDLYY